VRRRAALVCAALLLAAFAAGQESAPATRAESDALPGTAAGGWREFRGDPRNLGISHGPQPALTGVKWRFIADTAILNSPAVDAGVVYFGSQSGRLFAVRTRDGTKIWEKELFRQPDPKATVPYLGYSSPLLLRGRVYIGAEDGTLFCCDQKTGDVVWTRHLGGAGDDTRIWAGPKTDGVRVFLGSQSGIFWAFDADGGDVRWSVKTGAGIGASPAILGGELFLPSADHKLRAIDAASGVVRWETDLGSPSNSTPAIRLGSAFLRAAGGKVHCVDLLSRGIRWTGQLTQTSYSSSHPAHDGELVFVTQSAFLTAFDTMTGEEKWQSRVRSTYSASPTIVGTWVIAPGERDMTLHAFDRRTGIEVKSLGLTETLVATPTIVDGVVYVPGASGTLFAVE
jgi:outer membrane protein assembly factor BamB